MARFHRTLIY